MSERCGDSDCTFRLPFPFHAKMQSLLLKFQKFICCRVTLPCLSTPPKEEVQRKLQFPLLLYCQLPRGYAGLHSDSAFAGLNPVAVRLIPQLDLWARPLTPTSHVTPGVLHAGWSYTVIPKLNFHLSVCLTDSRMGQGRRHFPHGEMHRKPSKITLRVLRFLTWCIYQNYSILNE